MARVLADIRPRDNFRAPTYSGDGDIELFLAQFDDVAVANHWGGQATLLHLRAHLEGSARACGAGRTRDRIEEALRARFGLSQRQAKDRLIHLKRDGQATLHEQAMNVQRLVDIAYPRLSRADKEQMVIDHLLRALDNRALQRHMLTIQPDTVVDLVQAVDEWMAIGGAESGHSRVSARVVEAESPPQPDLSVLAKVLEAQSLLLSKLLAKVEALEAPRAPAPQPSRQAWRQPSPSDGCFQCGGPHWKRDCPQGRQVDLKAGQAVGQGPGAATPLPLLHSSREMEAARSDRR